MGDLKLQKQDSKSEIKKIEGRKSMNFRCHMK